MNSFQSLKIPSLLKQTLPKGVLLVQWVAQLTPLTIFDSFLSVMFIPCWIWNHVPPHMNSLMLKWLPSEVCHIKAWLLIPLRVHSVLFYLRGGSGITIECVEPSYLILSFGLIPNLPAVLGFCSLSVGHSWILRSCALPRHGTSHARPGMLAQRRANIQSLNTLSFSHVKHTWCHNVISPKVPLTQASVRDLYWRFRNNGRRWYIQHRAAKNLKFHSPLFKVLIIASGTF